MPAVIEKTQLAFLPFWLVEAHKNTRRSEGGNNKHEKKDILLLSLFSFFLLVRLGPQGPRLFCYQGTGQQLTVLIANFAQVREEVLQHYYCSVLPSQKNIYYFHGLSCVLLPSISGGGHRDETHHEDMVI